MTTVPAAICLPADSSWAKAMTKADQAAWDEIQSLLDQFSRLREAQLVAHLDASLG